MARTSNQQVYPLSTTALSRRLAAGESVQDLLDELVLASQGPAFNLIDLINPLHLLVNRGARLATGEKGCAFEILLKVSTVSKSAAVFSDILNDLMGAPGEVPLHIVARDSPAHLLRLAVNGWSDELKAGLKKRDARGRTVSHWLWAPDGLLVEHAIQASTAMGGDPSSEDALAKLWLGTVRVVWQVQQALHEQGVGLDIPDHDGVTAMELCIARLKDDEAVFLPGHDVCDRVHARMDEEDMAAATPTPAPQRPQANPRL